MPANGNHQLLHYLPQHQADLVPPFLNKTLPELPYHSMSTTLSINNL
ncbi:hypothetical protein [Salinisphaera sp. G21_0]|nr:hypothetical protein [Salinisphaera sp. G21_0]MBO9482580.1 hypothetical protein [Salinisphaera sp. G21_0]